MAKARKIEKDGVVYIYFECIGCDDTHNIISGGGRWQWNESLESPTFSPSVLVTYPANPDAEEEFKEWRQKRVCHSFVTDGKIQYLSDCTHHLAGQTIDLPEISG